MHHVIKSVTLPEHSALQGIYTSVDLADAYATDLPSDASQTPDKQAHDVGETQTCLIPQENGSSS